MLIDEEHFQEIKFTEKAKEIINKGIKYGKSYIDIFKGLKEGRDYKRENKFYRNSILPLEAYRWKNNMMPSKKLRRKKLKSLTAGLLMMPQLSLEDYMGYSFWQGNGKQGLKAYYDTNHDGVPDITSAHLLCGYEIAKMPFGIYDHKQNILYLDNTGKSDGLVDKVINLFNGERNISEDAPECKKEGI